MLAQELARRIEAADGLELLAPVELSAVCFRATTTPNDLDAFNRSILDGVNRRGRIYLSNATIDGTFALRACITNRRTTEGDLESLIAEVEHVASVSARLVRATLTDRPEQGGRHRPGVRGVWSRAMCTDPHLEVSEAVRVQILATEHWSLLATRNITYGAIYSRAAIFLTVVSAAVVALALAADATEFGDRFYVFALLVLPVAFLIGIGTYIRLGDARIEDFRLLSGLNRLRRAYLEIAPELEPYFVTGHHDDEQGLSETYGPGTENRFLRLIASTSTVVGVVDAVLAGVVGGLLAKVAGAGSGLSLLMGAAVMSVVVVLLVHADRRIVARGRRRLEPRFARPAEGGRMPERQDALSSPRADLPQGVRAQILATEHWSLLAARDVTYRAVFSRAAIFLTVVSATVVALALVARATEFGDGFAAFALLVLPVALFVGVATYFRLIEARIDDFWLLSGMNRLRHAYLEIAPRLEPYFVTGHHDDDEGLDETYGPGTGSRSYRLVGETSTLVAVINAALAGGIVGLVANAAGTGSELSLFVGAIVTAVLVVSMVNTSRRLIARGRRLLEPRFPR